MQIAIEKHNVSRRLENKQTQRISPSFLARLQSRVFFKQSKALNFTFNVNSFIILFGFDRFFGGCLEREKEDGNEKNYLLSLISVVYTAVWARTDNSSNW